jgi:hypothetical protein
MIGAGVFAVFGPVPHRAEVAIALVVCAVVLSTDLRGAIGFSSSGVLVYYLVANLSALTQDRADRRYPHAFRCSARWAASPWRSRCPGRPWSTDSRSSRSARSTASSDRNNVSRTARPFTLRREHPVNIGAWQRYPAPVRLPSMVDAPTRTTGNTGRVS